MNDCLTPEWNGTVRFLFGGDRFWGKFLQFALVHLQLSIIIGLYMDDGNSITSKLLRTKTMQFLGRISLSLYLTHLSTMRFMLTIWKTYNAGKLVERAGLPAVGIMVSPIIAYIITKYFEEPISKALRRTY